MAKFYGKIGFIETVEIRPGVWSQAVIEKTCVGDILSQSSKWNQNQESTNGDVNISNRLSIILTPYVRNRIHTIRYIKFMGGYWNVDNIEIQPPRLILSVGGVYNGETA